MATPETAPILVSAALSSLHSHAVCQQATRHTRARARNGRLVLCAHAPLQVSMSAAVSMTVEENLYPHAICQKTTPTPVCLVGVPCVSDYSVKMDPYLGLC